jgi:hypothetical protein
MPPSPSRAFPFACFPITSDHFVGLLAHPSRSGSHKNRGELVFTSVEGGQPVGLSLSSSTLSQS